MFELPLELQERYSGSNELPLEFPNGRSPSAMRMMIFSGFTEVAAEPPAQSLVEQHLCAQQRLCDTYGTCGSQLAGIEMPTLGPAYLEPVSLRISAKRAGATTIQFLRRNRNIAIGCAVQDVTTELGQPSRIFEKSTHEASLGRDGCSIISEDCNCEDPIQVLSGIVERGPTRCFEVHDYFYNYFSMGMDFMFDGRTHRLKKVIAYSNLPGQSEFSKYNKCAFRVVFQGGTQSVIVTPESDWADVKSLLGPCGRPMIYDTGIATNPFGSSFFYAYNGCIFKVLRNGHIASVTVFSPT